LDNIKAGDPVAELPAGGGFEELVEQAEIRCYVAFQRPKRKKPA
jgi:hypothetical protein